MKKTISSKRRKPISNADFMKQTYEKLTSPEVTPQKSSPKRKRNSKNFLKTILIQNERKLNI